ALSRIPVRIRVAVAFALMMALVLTWAGALLYRSVAAELTEAVDRELNVRAHDLSLVLAKPGGSAAVASAPGFVEPGERYGQLLDTTGNVVAATAGLETTPLLVGEQFRQALRRQLVVNRDTVPGLDEPSRF